MHIHTYFNDRCSFVQQGPDGEGSSEYPKGVGLPALSAQCPLTGGFLFSQGPLLNHV